MKTEIRTIESLLEFEMKLMNIWMKKEFGEEYIRNFKKDYPSEAKCFFVKDKGEILAFGILNPLVAKYLGEKYGFFGMGDILAIRKHKGHGRLIIKTMIKYLKSVNRTGLGFCDKKNTPFYKKVGLEIREDFMKRFRYQSPKTKEIAPVENGDGIFYEGDKFIQKILETNEPIYLDAKLW